MTLVGPMTKGLGTILSLVGLAGSMKSDIDKIRCDNFGRPSTGQVIQAQGRIMLSEYVINRLYEPAFITEFEDIAEWFRGGTSKILPAGERLFSSAAATETGSAPVCGEARSRFQKNVSDFVRELLSFSYA